MGKKAKFKKLRRLASQLPGIGVRVVKGEKVTGATLIDDGFKEVEGKPIDPKGLYRKKDMVQQPLNHHRKMKSMYNKYGYKGVNSYLNAVKKFIENEKANKTKAET